MTLHVTQSFYVFLVIFTLAITAEVAYDLKHQARLYHWKDTLINLFFGICGVGMRMASKGFWLLVWLYLYQYAPIKLPETWWVYVLLFFLNELVYYWFHRLSHERRWLWAIHVNHHSSQYLNFTTAARIPFFNLILHNLFWIPLLFLGFSPTMIFAVETIGFLFAFVQHTEAIKNFGILDYVLNSPAHHRIHHASNPQYLDKNYGNVLIIFDRIFGTFQPEIENEKPRYGITKNVNSYNPIRLIFHEWIDIFTERNAKS